LNLLSREILKCIARKLVFLSVNSTLTTDSGVVATWCYSQSGWKEYESGEMADKRLSELSFLLEDREGTRPPRTASRIENDATA
jgi:hypothetical protein